MHIRELGISVVLLVACGCNSIWNGFLDPSQVGRFRNTTLTMDLRRSVSVEDEPCLELEADDPIAEDLEVHAQDYVLRGGDVIDISIFELIMPGQPWVEMRQISQTGYITLPQVRQDIMVSGKTARELRTYIVEVLRQEQILTDPDVTVLIREARNMTYNIMGSVAGPGSNMIPRPNFRLLDALAASGGVSAGGAMQPMIKMVYVYRADESKVVAEPVSAEESQEAPLEFASLDDGTSEGDGHWLYLDGEWKFVKDDASSSDTSDADVTVEVADEESDVDFDEAEVADVDDVDVPASQPADEVASESEPVLAEEVVVVEPEVFDADVYVDTGESADEPAEEFGDDAWEDAVASVPRKRILAIPLDKLLKGDPRYNVVIRDGDTIWVPPVMQGEFYVMGNVNRPGTFSLTGREITIRQAVVAAGGLGALADPSRAELIRRIGGNQEQLLSIDIDRIFAGKEPDIILKADDVINVGTNPIMPFLAVLRNAFRFTYGFGFVYDRNFADIDSYDSKANPTNLEYAEKAARGF